MTRPPASKCPRCAECFDSPHHWLDNPDFGNDGLDPDFPLEHPADVMYVCKHCDAFGNECERCEGGGCDWCEFQGIVEATR